MMDTRTKNKETIRRYASYLKHHGFSSFLTEEKVPHLEILDDQTPPFHLERILFEVSLEGKNYELKDVFNDVAPDETFPYVCFKKKDSHDFFARVFPEAVFPDSWFSAKDPPLLTREEIYFRILIPRKPKENNFIRWTSDSNIIFSFGPQGVQALQGATGAMGDRDQRVELKNIPSLMNALKTRLAERVSNKKIVARLKDADTEILHFGGRFILAGFSLDPVIFSAYVTNDPVAQKYLFLDEYQKTSGQPLKTVYFDIVEPKGTLISGGGGSTKRFYTSADANPSTAVKLTMTSDGPNTLVRVAKVSSLANLTTVLSHFTALIDRFKTQKSSIINRYKKVGLVLPVPKANTPSASPKPKVTSRLDQLKAFEPRLFGHNYARYCQRQKQPIGLRGSADFVDNYLAQHASVLENNEAPFKLNYSYGAKNPGEVKGDDWYVCVPPPDNTKIYPYLLRAKHNLKKKTGLLDYDAERPFVPCCAEKNDNLKNWLAGTRKDSSSEVLSSIMQPDKIVRAGVTGYLPLEVKEAWNKTGETYLRWGVQTGPQSFIACLAVALGQDESDIRKKFSETVESVRTQETFGYTPARLSGIVKAGYVNPHLFLGIAQKTLNTRIFLYSVTKQFPKGDVAQPRVAFAYLTPLEFFKQAVVIVIHEDVVPPHCELIIKHHPTQKVFFPHDPLVKVCETIVAKTSRVFRVQNFLK